MCTRICSIATYMEQKNYHDILAAISCFYPFNYRQYCQLIRHNEDGISRLVPNYFKLAEKAKLTLDMLEKEGISWMHPLSPQYPPYLLQISDPPVFLNYRGSPAWLKHQCLSVVGSREPSQIGVSWLEEHLRTFLKTVPRVIVSGAARGIDQAAHSVALRSGRPTIAFLPSGLDNYYPNDFKYWMPEIIETGGAVISEYLPDEAMRSRHFHRRNRLIVGLSQLLLVVEAKRRSGSRMSAGLALNFGRDVAVVPGSPLDPQYGGNLDMLYEGAFLVRDATDLKFLVTNEIHRFKQTQIVPNM